MGFVSRYKVEYTYGENRWIPYMDGTGNSSSLGYTVSCFISIMKYFAKASLLPLVNAYNWCHISQRKVPEMISVKYYLRHFMILNIISNMRKVFQQISKQRNIFYEIRDVWKSDETLS